MILPRDTFSPLSLPFSVFFFPSSLLAREATDRGCRSVLSSGRADALRKAGLTAKFSGLRGSVNRARREYACRYCNVSASAVARHSAGGERPQEEDSAAKPHRRRDAVSGDPCVLRLVRGMFAPLRRRRGGGAGVLDDLDRGPGATGCRTGSVPPRRVLESPFPPRFSPQDSAGQPFPAYFSASETVHGEIPIGIKGFAPVIDLSLLSFRGIFIFLIIPPLGMRGMDRAGSRGPDCVRPSQTGHRQHT